MSDTILVTYATRYGSTKEVAERIGATLRESGFDADVLPMRRVESPGDYRAVVIGAPLYIGRWPKDAQRFLKNYQEALSSRPVAVFALGPTQESDLAQPDTRDQLDKELAKHVWLKPFMAELFGGKYDPRELHFPDNLLAILPASPLYHVPASDARDWAAIRAWAIALAAELSA